MQIMADLAHALDYIHNNTGLKIGLVHKFIESGSIIVTELRFAAIICHFGAMEICGETNAERNESMPNSRGQLSDGVTGYMSRNFKLMTRIATQKSNEYAFGVVV